MKKYVSIFSILMVCVGMNANAVPMTAQIRDLIQQKEDRIKKLEECEGKKKGWMIAGISTIGVTAVGVAGNIVLANKNKSVAQEIDSQRKTLLDQESKLSNLNNEIAEKDARKDWPKQSKIVMVSLVNVGRNPQTNVLIGLRFPNNPRNINRLLVIMTVKSANYATMAMACGWHTKLEQKNVCLDQI